MASRQYLSIRNNIYYFRRVIPLKLQSVFGKREIIKSLRTRDPKKAKILVYILTLQYEERFRKMTEEMSIFDFIYEMKDHGCDAEYLDNLIFEQYANEIETKDGTVFETCIDTVSEVQKERLLAKVREYSGGFTSNVLEEVIEQAKRLTIEDQQKIKSMVLEKLPIEEGIEETKPETQTKETSAEKRRDDEYRDIVLEELVDRHKKHRLRVKNRGKTSKYPWEIPKKHETIYRRLIEMFGGQTFIAQMSKERVNDIVDQIALLPANTARVRGKDVSFILENCSEDEPRFSPKNVNDYIDMCINLFEYAKNNDFYKWVNPFSAPDLKLKDGKKNKKRDPFEKNELDKIFEGDWFTKYSVKGVGLKHGFKPHHYWAPLIALYTGARNNEIASLYLKDIKKSHEPSSDGNDIWYFDINTANPDKKVKTENACRRTPIHPKLIKLGLLDYKNALEAKGEEKLFGYLSHNIHNGYGAIIGEHFNNYLKDIGIYIRYRKVFYSFRHTVNSELTRAKVQPIYREAICGRATGQTTLGDDNYTSDNTLRPVDLYDDVLKLNFDDELQKVKPFFKMDTGFELES